MTRFARQLIIIAVILLIAIWIDLPNNPGINALGINREIKTYLGLDLVGGVQALLEADLPPDAEVTTESMRTARTIVENRVNGLGVTEAVVQQAGDRRIVVEIPGETDPERAIATLKQTGLLEFVDMSSLSPQEANALEGTRIQTTIPVESTIGDTLTNTLTNQVFPTIMTGSGLDEVSVTQNQIGEYQISFSLKGDDVKKFADYTSANIGNVLAIVLDKQVISAPSINDAITDGQGIISGNFTAESANTLAVQLRYGSLPIPLKVVEVRTIGPTLGQRLPAEKLTRWHHWLLHRDFIHAVVLPVAGCDCRYFDCDLCGDRLCHLQVPSGNPDPPRNRRFSAQYGQRPGCQYPDL